MSLCARNIASIVRVEQETVNIKHLESLLPSSPPLAGRWVCYRCRRCEHVFRIDLRVRRLPLVPMLEHLGLLEARCPRCGCAETAVDGLAVS